MTPAPQSVTFIPETPMRQFILRGLVAAACAACGGQALGQHAKFTLIGEPNADAAAAPKENRFVAPITAPYFHENAMITNDVRAWFLYHDFPNDTILGEGDAVVAAVQLRLAITSRLQLVAYKDGYADFNTDLINDEGWMDIGAGLKYALIQDFKDNFHLAVGAGYEFPWGDPSVLQNDAEVRTWISADKGWGPFHLGGVVNGRFATTGDDKDFGNGDMLTWHVHADYRVTDWFSPVVELNGYHALTVSDTTPVEFHGADVGNFGKGLDDFLLTAGVGAEFRATEDVGLRGAIEFPLTDNTDLFSYRATFSINWGF